MGKLFFKYRGEALIIYINNLTTLVIKAESYYQNIPSISLESN